MLSKSNPLKNNKYVQQSHKIHDGYTTIIFWYAINECDRTDSKIKNTM